MGVKTGLHALAGRMARMNGKEIMRKAGACASKRMLELVIPLTPVDGGGLQASWSAGMPEESGRGLRVEVKNSAGYASFVEEGHFQTPDRYVPSIGKTLVEDFVPGQFFLRAAEEKYRREGDGGLAKLVEGELRQVFEDD